MTKAKLRTIIVIAILVFIFTLLIVAIVKPCNTDFLYYVSKIILAFAGGVISYFFIGKMDLKLGKFGLAGGGFAVFAAIFFFSPANLVTNKDCLPTDFIILKGNIKDSLPPHNNLQNVDIILRSIAVEQDLQTQTDVNGNFEIKIPFNPKLKKSKIQLEFSKFNYKTEIINGKSDKLSQDLIEMKLFPFKDTISRPMYIPQPKNECDSINEIVFERITERLNSRIKSKWQGTEMSISVNTLIDMLIDDNLIDYIEKLEYKTKQDTCKREYEFVEWLHSDTAKYFASGKYKIHIKMQSMLNYIANLINGKYKNWGFKCVELECIGFTDGQPVPNAGIMLDEYNIGIGYPRNPFFVFYNNSNCPDEHLSIPLEYYWVEYLNPKPTDNKIIKIINNCQLGATRSYVITKYLKERIYVANIKYKYATGGVIGTATNDNPFKRKTLINISLKAERQIN